jgi:hypothetical protein
VERERRFIRDCEPNAIDKEHAVYRSWRRFESEGDPIRQPYAKLDVSKACGAQLWRSYSRGFFVCDIGVV